MGDNKDNKKHRVIGLRNLAKASAAQKFKKHLHLNKKQLLFALENIKYKVIYTKLLIESNLISMPSSETP